MKSYNEMAKNVFRRRDEYKTAQIKKRKLITGLTAPFICLCLAAAIGFYGVGSEKTSSDSSLKNNGPNNTIFINEINEISSNRKINIDLSEKDFIPMTPDELNAYYQTNVFPIVPDDLKEDNNNEYGIYKHIEDTGEVYYDQNVINYYNKNYTRSVNIELSKHHLPVSDYGSIDESCKKSIINKTYVSIASIGNNEFYMAEFFYKNTGFRIIFEGLSQEEIISVLSSIIKIS